MARWDSLDYIYKQKGLASMHKFQYETIPEAIQDHFKKRLSHSRDGGSFNLPRSPKDIGRILQMLTLFIRTVQFLVMACP